MRNVLDDIRFALRLFRKRPLPALTVLLVLALGIGVNSAMFSIVDAVLIRPLPYRDPAQLAMLWQTEPELPRAPVTGPDYQDWLTGAHSFQSIAGGTEATMNLTGTGEPVRIQGFAVAPNMFDLLGAHAALGRAFQTGDDQPGMDHVAVLTYGLWQRAFGGDRAIVGREIKLDGVIHTVVGVMPREFRFPETWGINPEAFVPLVIGKEPWQKTRGNHWLFVLGRLKPHVSIGQANAELTGIAKQLEGAYPVTNAQIGARIVSLHDHVSGRSRQRLLILLLAVGFVLAIACANVANLTIAQTTARRTEMAVRLAMGASRRRIVQQLLTESTLLASLGAGVGLAASIWIERVLLSLAPPGYVPSIADVHINLHVFVFAAILAIAAGFISGLLPAMHSARTSIHDALKQSSGALSPNRLRSGLIIAEVACALVLSFAAGLTIQSLRRLLQVDLGFDPEHVVTMKVALPESAYPDDAHVARFFSAAVERVRALPGVQSAAAVTNLPLQGGSNGTVLIEGHPAPAGFGGPLVERAKVTPGYFRTLRIALLAGRDFTDADASQNLALINQSMARRFWPGDNPIGKRFSLDRQDPKWIQIIGVVADTRQFGIEQNAIPQAYFLQRESDAHSYMNLVVRTDVKPKAMARAIAGAIHALDPQLPLFAIATMDDIIAEQMGGRRFNLLLLTSFAALALLLAAVGIYGVMSYVVAQRTHEIGVRLALGASRANILALVLSRSARLMLIGVAIGVAGAFASGKLLATLTFGIKTYDLTVIAFSSLLLYIVGLFATYLPAQVASKVDPIIALRYE